MTTKINQKEYLKKYLSSSVADGKIKKKKKKKKNPSVKIIDDDIHSSTLDDNENSAKVLSELFDVNEEAPQIVNVFDERPFELIANGLTGKKWKAIGTTDNDRDNNDDVSPPRRSNQIASGQRLKRKDMELSSDNSPPRRSNKDHSNQSPSRKSRTRKNSDNSPPRRSNKDDSNQSPSRNSRTRKNSDNSPPRRSNTDYSNQSPSRHSRTRKNSSDNSPPRRSNKDHSNQSPSRHSRTRKNSSDNSPPRRSNKDHSNQSPSRRNKTRRNSDNSPPRRTNKDHSNQSPSRHSRTRKNSSDNSPPRRSNTNQSPSPRNNKTRKRRYSDSSPPYTNKNSDNSPKRSNHPKSPPPSPSRNSKTKQKYSLDDSPPPTHGNRHGPSSSNQKKLQKTLDGKTAGLQNARAFHEEARELRKREESAFNQMPDEMSGRTADVIVRDRRTGRVRDLKVEAERNREKMEKQREKKQVYDRWGAGLKQIADQQERVQDAIHEMNKPLARFADDKDLDTMLRQQERAGDPMLEYLRKKEKLNNKTPSKPMYQGSYPENRYSIPPGYRWDGVDRSNGYEKKWFDVQSTKKAGEEEAYRYSTEDM